MNMYNNNGDGGGGMLAYTGSGLTIGGASIGSTSLMVIAVVLILFGAGLTVATRRKNRRAQ